MKKFFLVLICVTMTLMLAGCGGEDKKQESYYKPPTYRRDNGNSGSDWWKEWQKKSGSGNGSGFKKPYKNPKRPPKICEFTKLAAATNASICYSDQPTDTETVNIELKELNNTLYLK